MTLKTETDTPAMRRRVLRAARELLGRRKPFVADFEHGQWWISNLDTGAQWSAQDAEGPRTALGFSFEQVTFGVDE
jgi:LmbE family N-acetylglucosaminyl deacetylase